MKKAFTGLIKISLVMFTLFLYAGCKEEEEFKTSWTSIETRNLETYDTNCKVVQDTTEGEIFYQYSLFDKNITDKQINNVTFKNLEYNNCGFEGKFKYGGGPIVLYGYLLNVDLDENSFYMLAITQNGGFELYYYSGDTSTPSAGYMKKIHELPSSSSPIKGNKSNTIKVDTVSENAIDISFNGEKVYTIKNPVNKRGAIGIFQMLGSSETDKANFKPSNPMVSLYQINKVQRY